MKKIIAFLVFLSLVFGQNKIPDIRLKMLNGKYEKLYNLLIK
jgi:hypothetical protein